MLSNPWRCLPLFAPEYTLLGIKKLKSSLKDKYHLDWANPNQEVLTTKIEPTNTLKDDHYCSPLRNNMTSESVTAPWLTEKKSSQEPYPLIRVHSLFKQNYADVSPHTEQTPEQTSTISYHRSNSF